MQDRTFFSSEGDKMYNTVFHSITTICPMKPLYPPISDCSVLLSKRNRCEFYIARSHTHPSSATKSPFVKHSLFLLNAWNTSLFKFIFIVEQREEDRIRDSQVCSLPASAGFCQTNRHFPLCRPFYFISSGVWFLGSDFRNSCMRIFFAAWTRNGFRPCWLFGDTCKRKKTTKQQWDTSGPSSS